MTESRYFSETLYITLLCFSNFSRFYNVDVVGFTPLIFWMYYKLIPSMVGVNSPGEKLPFFGWKSCDMAGSCGMICKSQGFYTRKAFINYTP